MWFFALVTAAVLLWFAWWVRHPHHHHTGGGRARDVKRYSYSRLGREYQGEPPTPSEDTAPGEYDGD
jgi:hypothetical protein